MNKTELYNLVLDEFNIDHVTDDDITTLKTRELQIIDFRFKQAVSRVCIDFSWSWLDSIVTFAADSDMGEKADYMHSYAIPQTVSRIIYVPSSRYRRVGDFLLSDDELSYAVVQELDNIIQFKNEKIPYEWWILVAYYLAFICCPAITNNDQNMINLIQTKYTSELTSLAIQDSNDNPRRAEYAF